MNDAIRHSASRRELLQGAAALAAFGSLAGACNPAAAQERPETGTVRFNHSPSICLAPQYLAGELLRNEGFDDVRYLPVGTRAAPDALADGRLDVGMWYTTGYLPVLDADRPVVLLAGLHLGCWELFGNHKVQSLRDLRGKTVVCEKMQGGDQILLSSMLAYVGIKPAEVNWLARPPGSAMSAFIAGMADAFLAFPPEPQELKQRQIGHVLLDTNVDKPWSQYYCCMIGANRDFVARHPIATKRVLRAILKATELCTAQPVQVAGYMRDHGYEPRYDIGLAALQRINYDYRAADPADTLRFHALRLRDIGVIRSTPQRLIERGTDWRFLNELKRELKA
ncbi:putative nitrate transport protein NrtA [Leptothrix cholodnii SP-6]|uniref:Putative nitrate transport protein NrtA n=1 Tax=Leptothrix cholodnii (strain ATCC 51168 / LMG 8142 / SP-6) TaxID=395495 RepID=B1Y594_LEPCP|nr:ABC transporter substrate-binding protein [Leptothrix cholodnii]ACB32324.1 putative nitrate transport protein NrtA [Leptothrix cholodnii SP-6]